MEPKFSARIEREGCADGYVGVQWDSHFGEYRVTEYTVTPDGGVTVDSDDIAGDNFAAAVAHATELAGYWTLEEATV